MATLTPALDITRPEVRAGLDAWRERMDTVRAQMDIGAFRQSWAGTVSVPQGLPIEGQFDQALEDALEQATDPAHFTDVSEAMAAVQHCFARWFVER